MIAVPSSDNLRAIKDYEKIGFKQEGNIQTPNGNATLVKIDRSLLKKNLTA